MPSVSTSLIDAGLRSDARGVCDPSGFFYGTSDEPKFCARHFYLEVVSGDGETNYKLKDWE
jgi:hypothetical protein